MTPAVATATATAVAPRTRTKPTDQEPPLRQLVAQLLQQFGTYDGIADEVLARAEADPALRQEIAALAKSAITSIAQSLAAQQRVRAVRGGVAPADRTIGFLAFAGFRAVAGDFILPGGKRLRDATPEECRAAAMQYDRTARDAAHKAKWLAAVADAAGDAPTIGRALTDDALQSMFEAAK